MKFDFDKDFIGNKSLDFESLDFETSCFFKNYDSNSDIWKNLIIIFSKKGF